MLFAIAQLTWGAFIVLPSIFSSIFFGGLIKERTDTFVFGWPSSAAFHFQKKRCCSFGIDTLCILLSQTRMSVMIKDVLLDCQMRTFWVDWDHKNIVSLQKKQPVFFDGDMAMVADSHVTQN